MQPHDDLCDHALAVIDQTLAGEPVAPEDADLAELTLILAGHRPQLGPAAAARLDRRVERRFAPEPRAPRSRRAWGARWAPGLAGVAGLAVAAVIAVAVGSGGSSLEASSSSSAASGVALRAAPGVAHGGAAASRGAPAGVSSSSGAIGSAGAAASAPARGTAEPGALAPADANGPNRQVIQGAQLALTTPPSRIEDVARQVFAVVAAQSGVVLNSNVTATSGPGGNAEFSLSVPSANLGSAMAALSRLRGASVVSRNDTSQDVTGAVGGAGRRLADARALRTALLRKLALATTTSAIDALRLQIRDANASIASDLATLRGLQRQVANSHIELTVNAVTPVYHPRPTHSGGLTIGRAVHDAGRVLVVAAGVALIALAVLVPLALLVALGLWLGHLVRQRRREQALDLV